MIGFPLTRCILLSVTHFQTDISCGNCNYFHLLQLFYGTPYLAHFEQIIDITKSNVCEQFVFYRTIVSLLLLQFITRPPRGIWLNKNSPMSGNIFAIRQNWVKSIESFPWSDTSSFKPICLRYISPFGIYPDVKYLQKHITITRSQLILVACERCQRQ